MGVVVAHGPVDLAQQLPPPRPARAGACRRWTTLAISLPRVVGEAGWPWVRASMGRSACWWARSRIAAISVVHQRQQHLPPALAQHQGVGQVVDVLGGAGEVDEFADRLQLGVAGDLLLEEVLHRLDVVVGGALDVLDPLRVGIVERCPTMASSRLAAWPESGGTSGICGWAARAWSQRTSTSTRWRISPYSLKMGRRSCGLARRSGRRRGRRR